VTRRLVKRPAIILIDLLLIAIAGCAGPVNCRIDRHICVGLVTDRGGIADGGLHSEAWDAIQTTIREGSIQRADYIETLDARDYRKNAAYFVRQGYDVVVSVGASQGDVTAAAAASSPTVLFVGVEQVHVEQMANLVDIQAPHDQIGFLAGWLAATLSRTGTIAAVCEEASLERIWLACEGFRAGAAYAKPAVRPLVRYRDDRPDSLLFADVEWAAATSRGLLELGADVIFGVGGATGTAALREAGRAGVYTIGSERDQWPFIPEARETLLTSFYPDPGESLEVTLRRRAAGELGPPLLQGGVAIAPFHDMEPSIPEDVRLRLLVLQRQLKAGEIQTGVDFPTS